jgi:hypothetical protein
VHDELLAAVIVTKRGASPTERDLTEHAAKASPLIRCRASSAFAAEEETAAEDGQGAEESLGETFFTSAV